MSAATPKWVRKLSILLACGTAAYGDRRIQRDYPNTPYAGLNWELNLDLGLKPDEPDWHPSVYPAWNDPAVKAHYYLLVGLCKPLVTDKTRWVWTWNCWHRGRGFPFRSTRWQTAVYFEDSVSGQKQLFVTEDGGSPKSIFGWAGNLITHSAAIHSAILITIYFGRKFRNRRRARHGFPIEME